MSTPLPLGLYRADHVGSLLRPAAIKAGRADCAAGKITDEQLRKIEDEQITECVQNQIRAGLRSITDGEFRRAYFHLDFLKQVSGVEVRSSAEETNTGGAKAAQDGFAPPKLVVTGKLQ